MIEQPIPATTGGSVISQLSNATVATQRRDFKKCGFTLIEILVVCAILALLSAIVLSAFSRVRGGAQRTTCASNLKQIGLATQMYAADNRDHFPNAATISTCAWADRLLPYIRQTSLFECPSATNSAYQPGCQPDDLDEFGSPINYDGGYSLCIYSKNPFPSSARFQHPSSTISVIDGGGSWIIPGTHDLSSRDLMITAAILRPRHQGGSNALFLDGHVKWMVYDSLSDRTLWNLGALPPIRN